MLPASISLYSKNCFSDARNERNLNTLKRTLRLVAFRSIDQWKSGSRLISRRPSVGTWCTQALGVRKKWNTCCGNQTTVRKTSTSIRPPHHARNMKEVQMILLFPSISPSLPPSANLKTLQHPNNQHPKTNTKNVYPPPPYDPPPPHSNHQRQRRLCLLHNRSTGNCHGPRFRLYYFLLCCQGEYKTQFIGRFCEFSPSFRLWIFWRIVSLAFLGFEWVVSFFFGLEIWSVICV